MKTAPPSASPAQLMLVAQGPQAAQAQARDAVGPAARPALQTAAPHLSPAASPWPLRAPLGVPAAATLRASRRTVGCRWLQWAWQRAVERAHPYDNRSLARHYLVELGRHSFTKEYVAEREVFVGRLMASARSGGQSFRREALQLSCLAIQDVGPLANPQVALPNPFLPVVDPPLCPLPRAAFEADEALWWGTDEPFALFATNEQHS